jgi:signal transduction histidine kinase/ligand-binding sensor domain-containing protein/DNA-binding response OmpR family regulator
LVILILLTNVCFAQNLFYKNYNVDNGLSQNNVSCVLQDHLGFMWFGTDDGLNKFDGYTFYVYRKESGNKNSLGSNSITAIVEDSFNNLWVGTKNGLYKFIRDQNKFIKINFPVAVSLDEVINKMTIWGDYVYAGTASGYVHMVNVKNNNYSTFIPVDENGIVVPNNQINSINAINEEMVLIGTKYTGLNILFPKKNKIYYQQIYDQKSGIEQKISTVFLISKLSDNSAIINYEANKPLIIDLKSFKCVPLIENWDGYLDIIKKGVILEIVKDKDNILMGINESYLISYNLSTKKIKEYKDNFGKVRPFNVINQIYIDKDNSYWIATSGLGVFYYNNQSNRFNSLFYVNNQNKGLKFSSIRSIYQDQKDELWIGGYGGLIKLNIKTLDVKEYARISEKQINSTNKFKYIPSLFIYKILKDFKEPNRYLWIGTEGQGLFKFDMIKEEFTPIIFSGNLDVNFEEEAQVFDLVFNKKGDLYVGTAAGLIKIPENGTELQKFVNDRYNYNSIQPGKVKTLFVDSDDVLWVGTDAGGVSYFDELENKFVKFAVNTENPYSLSNARINAIFEDSKKRLWIGTWGGGLNLFERETSSFKVFSSKDGFPNDVIYSILEGDDGNLWLSTNLGLTRFNFEKKLVVNFDVNDGLQANEFNKNAAFKGNDGILYFGGVNGITYFNPKATLENRTKPNVVLTSFKIFNKPALTNRDISLVKEIEILPEDRVFSFEFAGLSFYQPYKNKYKYRLVGFSNEWIELGTKRDITFTDLESGTYFLEILAANNDGIWSDKPFVLKIIVIPPVYKSWWFITISFLLIGGMVIGFVFYKIYENKKQKEVLERLVKQKTSELLKVNKELIEEINKEKILIEQLEKAKLEAEKADKAKSLFLANMSHEIRTPLNSVIGFGELLKLNIKDNKLINYINSIIDSGKILLNLIDDILDLSRIESGLLKLHYDYLDFDKLIEFIINNYENTISEKGLYFNIKKSNLDNILIFTDEIRIKQILQNLISNAIKFTEKGGIDISFKGHVIDDTALDLEICIKDTGVGISDSSKEKIFQNFYQSDGHSTRKYSGTGLGLSITKNLTHLLNGTITLDSEVGKGSSFCLNFNRIAFKKKTPKITNELELNINYEEISFNNQLIFIVDDNDINRKLIKAYLVGKNLRIIECSNGKEAVELLTHEIPDLILMDLRMPIMDGYVACSLIKQDEKLKYIPVIALTAAVLEEDETNFKDVGFNGYLIKPISKQTLLAEIYKYFGTNELSNADNLNNLIVEAKTEKIKYDDLKKQEIKNKIFELRTTQLPKVSNLLNKMVINNIEKFAQEILEYSETYDLEITKNWANKLFVSLNNFDLPQIIKLLNEFGKALDKLEDEIK